MSVKLYAQDIIAAAVTEDTPQVLTPPKFTASDAGCWFDGCRGYESIARDIILLAGALSMPDAMVKPGEELSFIEEDATKYLADFAPEGFWIGWQDGDFGMWPYESEGE